MNIKAREEFIIGVNLYYDGKYKESAEWFERANVSDYPGFAIMLAYLYTSEYILPMDNKKGGFWFSKINVKRTTKLAIYGDSYCQNLLGMLYEGGWKVECDKDKALFWFKKAANQINLHAFFNIGTMCFDHNLKEALYWYHKAADKGFVASQYWLSRVFSKLNDNYLSFYWAYKAAEKRDHDSENIIAKYYLDGVSDNSHILCKAINGALNVIDKDENLSLFWFQKSAEQENYLAQYNLGLHYLEKSDYEKAFYWFEKSAKHGDPDSEYQIALLCLDGTGTKQDENQAIYWLEKSSKQGHEEAKELLYSFSKDGFHR